MYWIHSITTEVKVKSKRAYQFHTFQFSDQSIFVLNVPAFWLLLQDLLQHHNALTHQIYVNMQSHWQNVILYKKGQEKGGFAQTEGAFTLTRVWVHVHVYPGYN